ncbi:hypothetical protein [Streptomyces sp. NPDC021622]
MQAEPAMESYSTAYWWSALFFAVGLVVTVVLYRRGAPVPSEASGGAAHM